MLDLIKNFGISPYLFGAQILNFLIILFILKKFAYKPIFSMLDKRRQTIEDAEKNAKKAQEALENAVNKEKKILTNAQNEAKLIINDAKIQSDRIISLANENGKRQVEKLLSDGKENINRDRKEMEKQLVGKVTKLAVDLLEKSLEGVFTEKEQHAVLLKAKEILK